MSVPRLEALLAVSREDVSSAERRERWALGKRIGFRFAFVYLVLYCFPFPLDLIPGADADRCRGFLLRVAVALAEPWLSADVVDNGSGDTTSDYIRLLFFIVVAAVATLIWSVVDRNRPHYRVLWRTLHVYVRYVLAATLFSYGFEKMLGLQFPTPSPGRLTDTFGDASPMGLLWTFIGVSPAYELVAGLCEVVGSMLVLFRRTTTLGALVLTVVMGNVVLLNFCYDVPVKLFSTHLLLMAMMLALPDFRRLANVLVLQRPTSPEVWVDSREPTMKWTHRAIKGAVVASLFYGGAGPWLVMFNDAPKRGLLDGAWSVSSTEILGPLLAPPSALQRISVMRYGVSISRKGEPNVRYRIAGQDDKSIKLSRFEDPDKVEATLFFELRGENEALLTGDLEGNPIHARLTRIDTSKTLLLTRGFHWINEAPFNR